jgi:hypothetical protein
MVCVLDAKLTTLVGTYLTMYAAAEALNISRAQIRRYIGSSYLVPTGQGYFILTLM